MVYRNESVHFGQDNPEMSFDEPDEIINNPTWRHTVCCAVAEGPNRKTMTIIHVILSLLISFRGKRRSGFTQKEIKNARS